ncbi:hypothetical protein ACFQ9X_33000 [Catenulispora yoronensis]
MSAGPAPRGLPLEVLDGALGRVHGRLRGLQRLLVPGVVGTPVVGTS